MAGPLDKAIRVEGLAELRRALRMMENDAPRELNKIMREALEPVELVASSRTPRQSGALQQANRIATKGNRVVLQNRMPYANSVHWGRKVWPSLRSQPPPSGRQKHASVIRPNRWLYDTLMEQQDEIGARVIRSIEIFIERRLPPAR